MQHIDSITSLLACLFGVTHRSLFAETNLIPGILWKPLQAPFEPDTTGCLERGTKWKRSQGKERPPPMSGSGGRRMVLLGFARLSRGRDSLGPQQSKEGLPDRALPLPE